MLAEIDGLAAILRTAPEASPQAELDDAGAQGLAQTLQPALARASAAVSGGAHAALLRLLA